MQEVAEGRLYSFPDAELRVLALWDALDAFRTQLRRSAGRPEYVFYDGPPFATGLPHYGHILAGTIKDIVTRYKTATGHYVTRRFGWDCHGLPVEYEIDQKLNIKTKDQVLEMGIEAYNEECRSIVMRYSKEWEKIITRCGRWIDFQNDYKTMDPEFMETVWWVFNQLHRKGLVYRGFKVMPYSTGCNTPLSNFEAGLSYKDVSDPAVMVSFKLLDDADDASLVAWTTTPWTLPSNLALCVNAKLRYVKVKTRESGEVLVVAESRASQLPPKRRAKSEAAKPDAAHQAANGVVAEGKDAKKGPTKKEGKKSDSAMPQQLAVDAYTYELLSTVMGADLVGTKYKPLFPYFEELSAVAFRVVADDYVTDDSGTGVVHCAPAFGEDDYRVCLAHNIIVKGEELPNPVDGSGAFTAKVSDFAGRYVKEADKDIIAAVKAMGRLVSSGSIMHSYPFCWRSDTPLLYKAVPSWFVAVEKIKDKLLKNNEQTYWVPDYVKDKRFHNWLESARDWAVSRSRFWGTPLPIWESEDGQEIRVIGSIQELYEASGFKATDLHRHHIDHVTIPSSRGQEFGVLKRVEEVFDCWFESGSMPYGYIHYPFENREQLEHNFPGDFVAEGLDQTRGWFYTLMVLATALFDKPAFKNLICNGLVLAEDGKKMSKRLKNYPPPQEIVDKYGADAMRLYLINSPVVRAEPLRFKKEGVFAVVKDVFLPWYNAYRFLVQNALRLEIEGLPPFQPADPTTLDDCVNILDRWIYSASKSVVRFVRVEMEAYRLYTVAPFLLKFVDNLTNIYVRFNRKRLKGRTGDSDCRMALSTLFNVLLTVCKVMAPFTPFFCEAMYQNLRRALPPNAEESVHYCDFPESSGESDSRIEQSVARMMTVIDLARNTRERHNKALKTPLKEIVVVHPDNAFLEDITGQLRKYVEEELNCRAIVPCSDPLQYATLKAEPDFRQAADVQIWYVLGKRLGKAMGAVAKEVKVMDMDAILAFEKAGEVDIAGYKLKVGEIKISREFKPPADVDASGIDAATDGDVLVVLDLRPDEELADAGIAREVVNRVQKLRKKAGLEPTDSVEVFIEYLGPCGVLKRALSAQVRIATEQYSGVADCSFNIVLARPTLFFHQDNITRTCGGNEAHASNVMVALCARDWANLQQHVTSHGGKIAVAVDGQPEYELKVGRDFLASVGDHVDRMEEGLEEEETAER
eukprot:SM000033S12418  [mRNA]  locus=s33:848870:857947:- [translate_table: standard]